MQIHNEDCVKGSEEKRLIDAMLLAVPRYILVY